MKTYLFLLIILFTTIAAKPANKFCSFMEETHCIHDQGIEWKHWHIKSKDKNDKRSVYITVDDCCEERGCLTLTRDKAIYARYNMYCFDIKQGKYHDRMIIRTTKRAGEVAKEMFCGDM